jgi:hypothetical protein
MMTNVLSFLLLFFFIQTFNKDDRIQPFRNYEEG